MSMVNFTQLFMQHAWHMDYWRMTMNGDNVFKKLPIWQVATSSAISLSPFFEIVHHQILWLYGQNFVSTNAMTFDMLFIPKTLSWILLKNRFLTMPFTSSITFYVLETSHFETGLQCLFHNMIGLLQLGTG